MTALARSLFETHSAREVGRRLGMTKNAVIGRLDREGVKKVKKSKIEAPTTDGCRWPIGHPKDEDFHFCGAERVAHVWNDSSVMDSYCQEHLDRAYLWEKPKITAPAPTAALVLVAGGLLARTP